MPEGADDTDDAPTIARGPDAHRDTLAQSPRATVRPAELLAAVAVAQEAGDRGARLEFERTLGEGGFGLVRLATQVSLGRKVAVKCLREGAASSEGAVQLLREAWITGALEHPNVVPVHDLGVDAEGAPYIILKRIEGREWTTFLADGEAVRARFGAVDPLEWNLRTLMQVCSAVHFAHSRGIVHRDLKPDNVMIGAFGEVCLLDWGIAVSTRDDGTGRFPLAAEATELAGTPAYMAPEMLGEAPSRITERTDVYLLGAMLFELIAGRPPHEGDSLARVLVSVASAEPAYPADAPAELVAAARRAMQRDPAARFASAEALRLGIQDFLQHRGSAQAAATAGARLEALLAGLAGEGDDPAEHQRRYRLFGECRFGFRLALDAWPGNLGAAEGLRRATAAMAGYELGRGPWRPRRACWRSSPTRPRSSPRGSSASGRSSAAARPGWTTSSARWTPPSGTGRGCTSARRWASRGRRSPSRPTGTAGRRAGRPPSRARCSGARSSGASRWRWWWPAAGRSSRRRSTARWWWRCSSRRSRRRCCRSAPTSSGCSRTWPSRSTSSCGCA
jgi:serine/threonine-protein kinase